MKYFDYKKAKKYIEDKKDKIELVAIGLFEDWGFTGGEYYNSKEGFVEDCTAFTYSYWATPVMMVKLKDGSELKIDCYTENRNYAEKE